LGKKGSTIREIQQFSGAKVVVSARGDAEEDDVNPESTRTVTITGSPSNAQMAQLLVTQKLQLVGDILKPILIDIRPRLVPDVNISQTKKKETNNWNSSLNPIPLYIAR
jgi:hypothetical protein